MAYIDALITNMISGSLGILFFLGWIKSYDKPKTEEEILREKNKKFTRKCKRLSGHCRHLQDVNTFLQGRQKESERREKQSQLSRATLNGELVRRDKLIRSLERQIQELRNKRKGRR